MICYRIISRQVESKEESVLKKILLLLLVLLSISLLADPGDDLHNDDESVNPPTTIQQRIEVEQELIPS